MTLVSLTQGHLHVLELCPRRFQHTYLDQLTVPGDPATQQRQEWGSRFHLAMHQQQLGLDIAPLLAQDPDLQTAVNSLLATAPDLFQPQAQYQRFSEYRQSLMFNGYSLTVVYDLLRIGPAQGQIIDWKTYQYRPSLTQLQQTWQTRLYFYVLKEITNQPAEALSMIYWFVPPPSQVDQRRPGYLTIPYNAAAHQRTRSDLHRLTDYLTTLLSASSPLPQVAEDRGHCLSCPFAPRCQRYPGDRGLVPEALAIPSIEDIPEIEARGLVTGNGQAV
ncbi:MAG: PD-(D/E)XK nuclease family protein [Cyanobacteria bacterium REEB459]|nr:PD-(D/E)XK nuclease family protein [Cyanobacteria bacterium REEB459]